MKTLFKHSKPIEKDFNRINFDFQKLKNKQNKMQTLSGKGVPSNNLGIDGNYYNDRETGNFYIKERGKWYV